jgi:hypothetical protein
MVDPDASKAITNRLRCRIAPRQLDAGMVRPLAGRRRATMSCQLDLVAAPAAAAGQRGTGRDGLVRGKSAGGARQAIPPRTR